MSPLYSKGRLELSGIRLRNLWSYLQDQLLFEIKDGQLDVSGNYEFDATGEKPNFLVHQGKITVRSLTVAQKEDKEEVLMVPHFTVTGADIDYGKKQIKIEDIQSNSSKVNGIRDEKGGMNLLTMFQPKPAEGQGKEQPNEPQKSDPWRISIGKFEIAIMQFISRILAHSLRQTLMYHQLI